MLKVGVLVSGGGTNLQAILDAIDCGKITNAEVSLVISNNPKAYALERAKNHNIEAVCISPKQYESREEFHKALLEKLKESGVELIVLAGFMLFIPSFLIDNYPHRIVNIHPSLLPKYGGKGMYGMHVHEAVKENNEKESGITIHFVNNEYDRGEIIAQYSTPVSPDDSAEEIAEKVHKLEYAHYPSIIEKIIREEA